jgi:hypothetical protein
MRDTLGIDIQPSRTVSRRPPKTTPNAEFTFALRQRHVQLKRTTRVNPHKKPSTSRLVRKEYAAKVL